MLRWTRSYFTIAAPSSSAQHKARQAAVLSFWFGTHSLTDAVQAAPVAPSMITSSTSLEPKFQLWFGGTPEIDLNIHRQFGDDVELAISGCYNHWAHQDKLAALALIIILDQFALNIYRTDKKSFEASRSAIAHTNYAISQKWDTELPLLARLFVYLPLEHSEALEDQKRSVQLFQQALGLERAAGRDTSIAENLVAYAVEHHDVVAKHGRFPGRNKLYGRVNTPEETAYLANGGVF
jgi:uncharacterized protein (DUF924 family)